MMATEIITQIEGKVATSTSPVELPDRNVSRVDSPIEEVDTKQGDAVAVKPPEKDLQPKHAVPKVRRIIDEEGGETTATVSYIAT